MAAVDIYDALATYWSAAGLDTSVGPLSIPAAPDNATPPYAVAFGPSGTRLRDSSKSSAEHPTIQISVFAPQADAGGKGQLVAAALDLIEDDNSLLVFSSGTLLDFFRVEPPRPLPDPGVDNRGRRIAHVMLTYRAWINQERA